MITGIKNIKDIEKQANKEIKNALNRTITKVKKDTINNMVKKTGIDKKILNKSSVMKTYRAKPNELKIKISATARAKIGIDDLKGNKTEYIDKKLGVKKIDINEKLGVKVITIDREGVLPYDPIAIKKAPDFFGRIKKGKDEYLKKSKKTIKELLEEEATTEIADEIFAEELKKK
ncbi:hypothetical protein AVBRAN12640_06055 [Campylobacter sp. RM12640]|uniref:hypothetical protein n=1 Tax=unclassified Campylobacter TaxID=2593542 RepID=UPI001D6C6B36|nr:hypothetical protein [Campylobacter sp. RM12640]MBZ7989671.1 hypothetical protein [Campylobacter sp. RM12635]MBZ7991729.1 hypothetical protein [Campylobacter sp. RM9331]MBZ8005217.1 hypothetical protein [Campylobacter sp. RM9332]